MVKEFGNNQIEGDSEAEQKETFLGNIKNFISKLGKWFWVLLIIGAFVVWRIVAASNVTLKVQTTKVTQGELVESISTSGTIKADQYSVLTFPLGGKISDVYVKTGQNIKKGQWIARLDTITLNTSYQEALNTYRKYQATAENILDQVKNHSSDETFSQKDTRTTAEANRDNAYEAVVAARNALNNAAITAPFNGIMDTVSPSSPGIQVAAASANYTIVNPDSVYFDAEIVETDLPDVTLGQNVKIKLDAYPDREFTGKVETIGMVAFTSSTGGNAYHVRITLPLSKTSEFRVGMQGDADIVLNTISKTTKVMSSAVVTEGEKNYLWIIENGKAKKVEVEIGKSSIDETEIKSGVVADQEVIDSPPSGIKQGQKVSK